MHTTDRSNLLTVQSVASRLGVAPRTVRRWAKRPDVALTPLYPLPGRLRFAESEVEALREVLIADGEAVA